MNTIPELDAAEISEYNIFILTDTSGSMAEPSTRYEGKNRLQEVQEFALGLAAYSAKVDDDGVTIISFGSEVTFSDNVTSDKVASLFNKLTPYGSTKTGAALKRALDVHFNSGKPSYIFVFTDGDATDKTELEQHIINASSKLTKASDLRIMFIQVGDDASSTAFLARLNNGLKVAKFDIVATVNAKDAENLSVGQLFHLNKRG